MTARKALLAAAFAAGLALLPIAARAGGPLFVNETTRTPFVYGPGPVPVYYDQGNFAVITDYSTDPPGQTVLDNGVGRRVVEKGFADWTAIASSSFEATVVGDFSTLGLADVDAGNAAAVVGKYNGGGIYVVFDADGSIMQNFFGVGPNVLGIATPEWVDEETGTVIESWVVLNGAAINPGDAGAASYQGIATHEFGHSIGLAHTQLNGHAVFYRAFGEAIGPQSCAANLPYPSDVVTDDVETMYPFADPTPGTGTGAAQANIHTRDDIAAISDLYPGPGWPDQFGTISGVVFDASGNKQLSGVNVVARNVADPVNDAVSAISGQATQGLFGPDGRFTIHGLTPGAEYVLYLEAVLVGGYPTEPAWFLPGPEKFYGGPLPARVIRDDDIDLAIGEARGQERGIDHGSRLGKRPTSTSLVDPCSYRTITAEAGKDVPIEIQFDRTPGAPVLINLGYAASATDVTGDGKTVVGNFGRMGPIFRWTEDSGIEVFDGVLTSGEPTYVSDNGRYLSANLIREDQWNLGAYRWDAENGWLPAPPAGYCGVDTTGSFGVANDGTVYGLAWKSCTDFKAFRWNPDTDDHIELYPSATTRENGSPANGRPNQISADGSVLVGWEENDFGERHGVLWVDGIPSKIENEKNEWVGEALSVSHDGTVISGMLFDIQEPYGAGWRRPTSGTTLEYFDPVSADAAGAQPFAMSKDGGVMAGMSGNPFFGIDPGPFLWTKEMGTVSLDDFIQQQGTSMEQWFSLWTPMAMSDDGSVIVGWGIGFQFFAGWVLQIPNASVCHGGGEAVDPETVSAKFPAEFDEHLSHGDTVGPCQQQQLQRS